MANEHTELAMNTADDNVYGRTMYLYLSKLSPARARWVLARPRTLLDKA
jgi:hypothetical protein